VRLGGGDTAREATFTDDDHLSQHRPLRPRGTSLTRAVSEIAGLAGLEPARVRRLAEGRRWLRLFRRLTRARRFLAGESHRGLMVRRSMLSTSSCWMCRLPLRGLTPLWASKNCPFRRLPACKPRVLLRPSSGRSQCHKRFDGSWAAIRPPLAATTWSSSRLRRCCQFNANSSPMDAGLSFPSTPQATSVCHSARAAERRVL
jgi:hypothetical protein